MQLYIMINLNFPEIEQPYCFQWSNSCVMNILETKIFLNLYWVCSMIKSFCPLFTKLFYFEFTGTP